MPAHREKGILLTRSNTLRAAAVAALLMAATAASSARSDPHELQKMTYWSQDLTYGLAYSITWDTNAHRAHFVETYGNFDGSYADDGAQRTFTLDQPLVLTYQTADCNGNAMTQTDTTTQLVFRTVSGAPDEGMSAVVPIGYTTDVDGCTPGLVAHYGTPSDAGIALFRRALSLRPPMDDLVPGARIAGLAENPIDAFGDLPVLSADVVAFDRGHVTFEHTGHRYPATMTPDGWLVVDFATFRRGYMRIHDDRRTGGEIWFGAEWQDGAPASIELTPAVRPTSDAGFDDRAQVARNWLSGLFQYDLPPTFELYRDGQGQVLHPDGSGGPPQASALAWHRAGAALQIVQGDASASTVRTWQPIAAHGANHFVFESEDAWAQGVDQGPLIVSRVNWYVDQGPSTEPAAPPQSNAAAPLERAQPRRLPHFYATMHP